MSLLTILSRVAADTGARIANSDVRAYTVGQINNAARTLWEFHDLKNCEREMIVRVDDTETSQQITLPAFVHKVIAVRDYDTRFPYTQTDARPRYSSGQWARLNLSYPYYQFRLKELVALARNIANATRLIFTLPSESTSLVSLRVVGKTAKASRIQEVVVFPVGTRTVTTTNVFITVESITKSSAMDMDITVTAEVDATELAIIPNTALSSEYRLVQLLDRNDVVIRTPLIEVLYKPCFTPFVNDGDQFQSGDVYDEAIYWKSMALINSKVEGKEKFAQSCSVTADVYITNVAVNQDGPLDKPIQFEPSQVSKIIQRMGGGFVTRSGWYNNNSYQR